MYINKTQEAVIRRAVNEICELTTLKTCGIDFGKNEEIVKLWLMWFEIEANKITEVLDTSGRR